jgi:hypothetical protein
MGDTVTVSLERCGKALGEGWVIFDEKDPLVFHPGFPESRASFVELGLRSEL